MRQQRKLLVWLALSGCSEMFLGLFQELASQMYRKRGKIK